MNASSDAGYSGKPAWQKLGLKADLRVLVRNAPGDYAALVGARAGDVVLVGARAAFDIAHVFATAAAKLEREIAMLSGRLPDDGVLWISWPKKAAKADTDITEDTVRRIALPLGLVDVKVCAVDAVWSGLKLVRRRALRGARPDAKPR